MHAAAAARKAARRSIVAARSGQIRCGSSPALPDRSTRRPRATAVRRSVRASTGWRMVPHWWPLSRDAPMPASLAECVVSGPESLTPARLQALLDAGVPTVLRGLCRDWPLVAAARQSPSAFAQALAALDSGAEVDVLELPPDTDGVVGYNAALDGFNYRHFRLSLTDALTGMAARNRRVPAVGVALQSAPVADCAPTLAASHPMPVLPADLAPPRLWVGTRVTTPAHVDASHNLAVVLCGRRRFTLFPTDQVGNLYMGPLDFAPTLSAITTARPDSPDLQRHPRLAEALEHALVAELAPGDALYMPPLWWHQVQSLEPLNALLNYWWMPARSDGQPPPPGLGALLHALLAFRELPARERAAWKTLFDHYVFAPADPAEHLPPQRRGILGTLTPELLRKTRERILRLL
jgi:hypothetical protein